MTRQQDQDYELEQPPAPRRTPRARGAAPPLRDPYRWRSTDIRSPVPGLIPGGGISMLSGATGVGKTALLATMTRRILDGRPVFGFPPVPDLFVGYVSTDRRWATTRHWLDRAGVAECERFRAYCLLDDPDFDWRKARKDSEHAEMFADAIDVLKPPPHALVIFDPIALYMGRRLGDYSETAAAIGQLSAVCVKKEVNVLGSAHVRKAVNDEKDKFIRPQDRILGTTAIASYTNTQIYLVGPEETGKRHYLVGYVAHELPPAEFKFVRDGAGLFIPYTAQAAAETDAEDIITEIEKDPVFAALPETGADPISTKNLIAFSGKSKSVVHERLKRWDEQGFVERVADGLWRKRRRVN